MKENLLVERQNYLSIKGWDENEIQLHFLNAKRASSTLRAINNKFRQEILKLLEEKENLTVTEIYAHLKRGQVDTSKHLGILRRNNILLTNKVGKFIYYRLNNERLEEINTVIQAL